MTLHLTAQPPFTLDELMNNKLPVKAEKDYRWDDDRLVEYPWGERQPSFKDRTGIEPGTGWAKLDYCRENSSLAFTQDGGLYISSADSQPFVVAKDEDQSISYGVSVHRNEFGITKGTFWSPQGNYLAFYRLDETLVGDYPLVNHQAREAELKSIKYPMAGMDSERVGIGIYTLQSGETVYLQTGDPTDRYFTNISWSPDEQYLYVVELNRAQNHLSVDCYDRATGIKARTLFEETSDTYVEPQHPIIFLPKGKRFVWQSNRDGFQHLYLYRADGTLERQLTQGNFDVLRLIGFDPDEKHLFILSNQDGPLEQHIYKVNIRTGKSVRLTTEPGVHVPTMNASGTKILDRFSNHRLPLAIDLIDTKSGKAERLQTAPDPFVGRTVPEIVLGQIKAADDTTDLYYRMLRPVDFDPTKRYPVIVYVYGGPHSQQVTNAWGATHSGWEIFMAQKGYLVFCLDNRGTSNRGRAFETVTHRRLGEVEAADQLRGIDFLRSLPYVDADRVGVHGWSYGGYMTANLMLRYPDVYRVGVAGAPVMDWKYYEVMYGERYMGTPENNPEGYRNSSNIERAGALRGRLLVVHGDEDSTVVPQHSLAFVKACIAAGTFPDFALYPGHAHAVWGNDRMHLYEKITRYFDEHLK